MAELKLPSGAVVLFDDEDAPLLAGYNWFQHSEGYVVATSGTKRVRKVTWLHRLIASTPDSLSTDHANGNKLDNRRSNLRSANGTQNSANRSKQKTATTSRFKGVSFKPADARWNRDKWLAKIKHKDKTGKQVSLGFFDSEVEAAEAYNAAAKVLFGEFALLNET